MCPAQPTALAQSPATRPAFVPPAPPAPDIQQLDGLLRALGFTQAKADSEVRWAVLNIVSLLRRHAAAHDALADAMDGGAPLGECLVALEAALPLADEDL